MRLALVIAIVVAVSPARADDSAAAAKALFDQGKTLFAEGKYGEACAKLEASYTINKLSGTGGLLGACYEKLQRYASAWAAYRDSAVIAEKQGNVERATAARASAAELEPKLAWLTIDASAVLKVPAVVIKIDGVAQPAGAFGDPRPVDGGQHIIEATALDYRPFKQTIDIADTEKQRVAIPALVEDPTRKLELQRRANEERRIARRRTRLAYGFGIGGAASIAVATTLGVLARSQWNRARDLGCSDTGSCPAGSGGAAEIDGAATKADVATYVGAAGVLLVGAGVFIRLTTPKPRTEAQLRLVPTAHGTAAGFALEGRW